MASIISASTVESASLSEVMGATNPSRLVSAAFPTKSTTGDTKAQISPIGRLQNTITALSDAAAQLTRSTIWQSTQAISSNEASVEALSDGNARVGTYEVDVAQIASPQIVSSTAFSSLSTVIGLGTMTIEAGSWNSSRSTFTTNPNWPKANITIGPGDNTMQRVRDKINASAIGVIAEVVTDATGTRLVLRSTATGLSNGFKVSVDSADASTSGAEQSLSALGFDPSKAGAQGGMSLVQAAQNAKLTVNGETLETSNNVVRVDADRLTLQLKKPTSQPLTVQVLEDPSQATQAITNLVQSYNAIQEQLQIGELSNRDLTEKAQSVTQVVSTLLTEQTALADIGLKVTSQGKVELNRDQLTQSLETNLNWVREQVVGLKQDRTTSLLSQLTISAGLDESASNYPGSKVQDRQQESSGSNRAQQRLLQQYQTS